MDLLEKTHSVIHKAKEIIYGQDELLESIVAALVCEGHLLIEGLPGLGKTLSVSVMSKLCDLEFQRIQFTPLTLQKLKNLFLRLDAVFLLGRP